MQLYFITVFYLYFGSALLLVDEYGGRYLLLIRLRNMMESTKRSYVLYALLGFVLMLLNIFFPVPPGPVLLGDLLPVAGLFFLLLYALYRLAQQGKGSSKLKLRQEEVLRKTGLLLEYEKKSLGLIMVGVATLHLLFPKAVLL